MPIKTASYSMISEDLSAAIEWIKRCGASVHKTRYEKYQQLLDYWSQAYVHASEKEGSEVFPDFVTASVEAVSLIHVHKTFQELPREQADQLRKRIAKAVNGPFDAAMENSNTNFGRNFLFELATLARFHAPSEDLAADLSPDFDAGFTFMNNRFFIECKRPHSKKSLPKLMLKAAHQIGKRLIGTNTNHKAIIAIDASKILNPRRSIFAASNADDLPESMSRLVQGIIDRNAGDWAEQLRQQSSRIVAVAVRIAFPAIINEEKMIIASNQWGIWPTPHATPSDKNLLESISHAIRETQA